MYYFDPGKVKAQLESIFKNVQKWPDGKERTDANWLCSKLALSLDEAGKALRENKRLHQELSALQKRLKNYNCK